MSRARTARLSTALLGTTIVLTVDRRSGELAAALERHGAQVRHAPALTIVPHIDDVELVERTRELIARPPDVVVVTTGVGFRGWVDAADEAGLLEEFLDAIRGAQILARGPKARGAIQQAGLTANWVAETETSAELGRFLLDAGVTGRRIAVQHHGSGADGLDELLTGAGAEVVSLTIYRWGPPPDAEVVRRSVAATAAGEVDVVVFTSAPGADEWLTAAERAGAIGAMLAREGDRQLLLAAVGPITAGPLWQRGFAPLVPDRGRLGALVRAIVAHVGGGQMRGYDTAAGRLELRSGGAVIDGNYTALSRTGTEVLGTLCRAGGAVVSREQLLASLPRSGQNAHAVEVAVARVREALSPAVIKTVVKRGYRLNTVEAGLADVT